MHTGGVAMAGWFPVTVTIVSVVLAVAAVAVLIDAMRRPRSHFGAFGRWPYVVVQGGFIALSAIGFVFETGVGYAAVTGIVLIVAFVQMFVYLLRVVFPTNARLEARAGVQELAASHDADEGVTGV